MKRQIIKIDEELCDGCGACVPECKEGALQIIDGKARLISDLFCDGLGACIGHCPQGAITIEEREAEPYDERKVMETIVKQPASVLKAHLEHLKDHGAIEYYNEALDFMKEKKISLPVSNGHGHISMHHPGGCPGSAMAFPVREKKADTPAEKVTYTSELNQWPIQLHLVRPEAPYFKNTELVVMSTCGPLASPSVHPDYLRNRAVVVACPKLDNTEPYTEKLAEIFRVSGTPKVIVVIMEVPCCRGLARFAAEAVQISGRTDVILEIHTLSIDGSLINVQILN